MPESAADTFWGKGFLATALGTASPDRKKTHKGQKVESLDLLVFWQYVLSTWREKNNEINK